MNLLVGQILFPVLNSLSARRDNKTTHKKGDLNNCGPQRNLIMVSLYFCNLITLKEKKGACNE